MSKIVDFLHATKVFYLATVDGEQAQVRPINSVIKHEGQIYFETSNKKAMFRQMLANPNVAISGMAGSEWIRITGKVIMDSREEMKDAMFAAIPSLKTVYTRDELEVFYLEDIKAFVHSFTAVPVELKD